MGYIKVKDMTKEQYKEYRNKAKSYYDKNKEKISKNQIMPLRDLLCIIRITH